MSEFRRAYDLLRGYVNREWDRMRSIEWSSAWDELHGVQPQAEEKDPAAPPPLPEGVDAKEVARNILGVAKDAEFEAVRDAFRRLHRRSDPSAFPPGSDESRNAARIQQRVTWAYTCLTAETDETERRFRSLEIE